MNKVLNRTNLEKALKESGRNQADLAKEVGVSAQSVTNWIQGAGFPRPDKLLKLAMTLKLTFEELVERGQDEPIIAFRKKAGTKTTDAHLLKAVGMGKLLRPLVPYLPQVSNLRTKIAAPEVATQSYARMQADVAQVRKKLGLGELAAIEYSTLIAEFRASGAVLVPVLWGEKKRHENALHILLPAENVTFVFLNLDTKLEDFKFWMAHELAHVYTPELAGTDEGEDFSDAFAGALLFPQELAKKVCVELSQAATPSAEVSVLSKYSKEYEISLYTVFQQVAAYRRENALAPLKAQEKQIHVQRSINSTPLVSVSLFKPLPPSPTRYIGSAKNTFHSDFFDSLKAMLNESGTGVGYVQQVLDISLRDATAVYAELVS
jgi:transcriptional regulator with XRE-family HTH domain